MKFILMELLLIAFFNNESRNEINCQYRDTLEKIKKTPLVKNKKYNIPESDFTIQLMFFLNNIHKNFKKKDLHILYNNISSLKFKYLKNNIDYKKISSYVMAAYEVIDNNILFFDDNINDCIDHELFHMASTYSTDDHIFSGFSQIEIKGKLKKSYGDGLNEGYTDLLAYRYFDRPTFYKIELEIAKQIEFIVGKEVMEKLYLRADLKALVDKLSKYTSLQEINNFINNLDIIYSSGYMNDVNYRRRYENKHTILVNLTADKIICFLYKIYVNKLKKELKEDKKNNVIKTKKLIEYNLVYLSMLFRSYNINCFSVEEVKEINVEKVKKIRDVKLMSFY